MPISTKRAGLIGAVVALACAAPLFAQQVELGKRDPALVSGGTYKVDNYHTMVRWEVDHLGITPYFGIFGDITGTLTLDPKNAKAAKVDITIPVSKITTTSAELTAHILRPAAKAGDKPDFFGANPVDAHFVSTSVVPSASDPMEAKIAGNLTLNGVTKPVTLDATFHGAGKMPKEMGGQEMVGFEAEASIKRSDFGVDMGIPMVSDQVDLDIVAAFVK